MCALSCALRVLTVFVRPCIARALFRSITCCAGVPAGAVAASLITDSILWRVRSLNADPSVHGIIVQLPMPAYVDAKKVLAEVR